MLTNQVHDKTNTSSGFCEYCVEVIPESMRYFYVYLGQIEKNSDGEKFTFVVMSILLSCVTSLGLSQMALKSRVVS